MNKRKNNPNGGEDQAQPDSKTPPSACEAKSLAPNIESILGEISNINGALEGVKGELATLAGKPDVDLSPISTFIGAVEKGFTTLSADIQALTQAQANAASKEDLDGLASKSDIDQIKQMFAGQAFAIGQLLSMAKVGNAGINGLNTKVDDLGVEVGDIKINMISIEQKMQILIEGMDRVIDDLCAIRAGLNSIEGGVNGLIVALADVKKDTLLIPQVAADLDDFRTAFNAASLLSIQAISSCKTEITNKFVSKIDAYNQNVNKLSASVSLGMNSIIGLSDGASQILGDINQISKAARGAANMAEAALKAVADSGADAVGEALLENVKAWLGPLIKGLKEDLSDEKVVAFAGSIAKSGEEIAAGVNALNRSADDIPKAVKDLMETLKILATAKEISYEDFVKRSADLEAAYKKIDGHLAGVEGKADAACASIIRFEKASKDTVDTFIDRTSLGIVNSIESRLVGIEDGISGKVISGVNPYIGSAVVEALRENFVAEQEQSITP